MGPLQVVRRFVPRPFRQIVGGPVRRFRRVREEAAVDRLRRTYGPQWGVEEVWVHDTTVEVSGWSLPPGGGPSAVGFTANGRPFDTLDYPRRRPDVGRVFADAPGGDRSGFRGRADFPSRADAFPDGFVALRTIDRSTGRPLRGETSQFYPDPERFASPLPDAARRRRVHGGDGESSYLRVGATTFNQLRRALRAATGRDFADCRRVLDWGCGCGRVGRYFAAVPGAAVTGIDIDADNVAWCARHLGFGTFLTTMPTPPTPLPAAAFDLVIGVSIFTHLGESDQFAWLGELARVTAPGAAMLVTVHGLGTTAAAADALDQYRVVRAAGFVDVGRNSNLDGAVPDTDSYRNILHSHAYIRATWPRYLPVVGIVPGHNGEHDIVVMRKP